MPIWHRRQLAGCVTSLWTWQALDPVVPEARETGIKSAPLRKAVGKCQMRSVRREDCNKASWVISRFFFFKKEGTIMGKTITSEGVIN